MSAIVHIAESDIRDLKSLLDMARKGAVVVDSEGETFQIVRQPGRTLTEIFSNPRLIEAMEALDEDWSKDMEEIIALRKTEPYRDPWEQ